MEKKSKHSARGASNTEFRSLNERHYTQSTGLKLVKVIKLPMSLHPNTEQFKIGSNVLECNELLRDGRQKDPKLFEKYQSSELGQWNIPFMSIAVSSTGYLETPDPLKKYYEPAKNVYLMCTEIVWKSDGLEEFPSTRSYVYRKIPDGWYILVNRTENQTVSLGLDDRLEEAPELDSHSESNQKATGTEMRPVDPILYPKEESTAMKMIRALYESGETLIKKHTLKSADPTDKGKVKDDREVEDLLMKGKEVKFLDEKSEKEVQFSPRKRRIEKGYVDSFEIMDFRIKDSDYEIITVDDSGNPNILKEEISIEEYQNLEENGQLEYEIVGNGDKMKAILKTHKAKPKKGKDRIGERIKRKDIVAKGISKLKRSPIINRTVEKKSEHKALWRLPSYVRTLNPTERITHKKCNDYLQHMCKRIRKEVARGNLLYAGKIGLNLIQRSKVFAIYILTRTCKGYFWKLKEMDVMSNLNKYAAVTKGMHTGITTKRYYIPKGNGKYRPIGAPNLWSKMVFKAIEVVMRELIENRIGKYQHGFVRDKGCQTASKEVIKRLRDPNMKVYEFDLKSFFNKVNVLRVTDAIERDYGPIGDWIRALTVGNIPRINAKHLKEEDELEFRYDEKPGARSRKMIHRFGFTQGSPLSPLLCNYALELGGMGNHPGLTMFADDGIILSDKNVDIKEVLGTYACKLSGAKLSEAKPFGEAKKFKFLGLDYNLEDRTVWYQETVDKEYKHLTKKKQSKTTDKKLVVVAMLNLDENYTESELNNLVGYSSYSPDKGTDKRIVHKESMVRRISWLDYYSERSGPFGKGLTEYVYKMKHGLEQWLQALKSEPKGEGWNDAWCSTIAAISMVESWNMRGNLRKGENYMLPGALRGFDGVVTGGYRKFKYESIDREILTEYYEKFKWDKPTAWGESLEYTDDAWMWIGDAQIAQEEQLIRDYPEERVIPIVKRYID